MGVRVRLTRSRIMGMVILLAVGALSGIYLLSSQQNETPDVRYLTVNAYQWGFSPSVIRVDRGDTLIIRVKSLDSVHGFSIDGYDISERDIVPGTDRIISTYAGTSGKFKIRCNTICGPLHPFMTGELIVEPDTPSGYTLLITLGLSITLISIFLLERRESE